MDAARQRRRQRASSSPATARCSRWEAVPSPDGKWVAHHDKDQPAVAARRGEEADKQIDDRRRRRLRRTWPGRRTAAGSPTSRPARTPSAASSCTASRTAVITALTTDRFDSCSPACRPDGQVALLPLRPQPQVARPGALGQLPARAVPRPQDQDLRPRPQEGLALALRARRRAAPRAGEAKTRRKTRRTTKNAKEVKPVTEPVTIDLDGIAERLSGCRCRRATTSRLASQRQAAVLALRGRRSTARRRLRVLAIGREKPNGQDRPRGRQRATSCPPTARSCSSARPTTSTSSTPATGPGERSRSQGRPVAAGRFSVRAARGVAADVRRGLAAGARLLLRPRHARRSTGRRSARSTGRSSSGSRAGPSCPT